MNSIPSAVLERLRRGTVIPAHPLALNADRRFDVRRQRALTRYYIDAGVGGLAVGVHTTQFEIRRPEVGLFKPVLQLAAETIDDYCSKGDRKMICKIAGVCGKTAQAVQEASFARDTGYHACLLSLAALADADVEQLLCHCEEVAQIIPVIGFYLQPAVGGCVLPFGFWRRFAEIENVIAIKMAPFNRYQTLDVIRGVCEAGREDDITLYTGNDDNIVIDLLTPYKIGTPSGTKTARIVGGLLGHWAVWTRVAVGMLERLHKAVAGGEGACEELLTLAVEVTDCNAAFFDAANHFAGCIAGIHEVLCRQGLMEGTWCLNPQECLSPGQTEEIDRVYRSYPHLNDDEFVRDNLGTWLAE